MRDLILVRKDVSNLVLRGQKTTLGSSPSRRWRQKRGLEELSWPSRAIGPESSAGLEQALIKFD